MACPSCECKTTYAYDADDTGVDTGLMRCAACGAVFDSDDELPEDEFDDLASTPKRRVKCAGGRTEHTMEPEWKGNSFTHMKCRWCGKREVN